MMHLLGLDIGSSSVKAAIINAETGKCISSVFYPENEMPIMAPQPGFAEQDPFTWWEYSCIAIKTAVRRSRISKNEIKAIGISYQMHGLVMVDRDMEVIRPSIIWCDSRATEIGEKAFVELGKERCLGTLLNSPGNFTASKLKWVMENQPELYSRIYKIMLPGDYIAMKLTGEIKTTVSGLSEAIMWNFSENKISDLVLDYYGINHSLIPGLTDTFGVQGKLTNVAAAETGLPAGITVSYRAGDQPNNAFSLNVLKAGEIAAVAGTSGVVYGVSDEIRSDPFSRVNTFAHVNHSGNNTSLGILLCINGTGILNSWLKRNLSPGIRYDEMNRLASTVGIGSDGLVILPFGNGAERVLMNSDKGAQVSKLNLNIHSAAHMIRAAHEGIAFSFKYGIDIMKEIGLKPDIIRANHTSMFLSPVFRQALSTVTGAEIELYNSDGAQGAARAAGVGAGIFNNFDEAFTGLSMIKTESPSPALENEYNEAYNSWLDELKNYLKR